MEVKLLSLILGNYDSSMLLSEHLSIKLPDCSKSPDVGGLVHAAADAHVDELEVAHPPTAHLPLLLPRLPALSVPIIRTVVRSIIVVVLLGEWSRLGKDPSLPEACRAHTQQLQVFASPETDCLLK